MDLEQAKQTVLAEMVRLIVMDDGQRELLDLAWREFQELVADTGKIDESFVRAAVRRARRGLAGRERDAE